MVCRKWFHAAAHYVPYIAGGVFFYGVLQLANAGLLLAKQLNWVAAWWLAGGVVCTLLNLALVPKYGGMGAAVTQSASFGLMCIGILTTSQAKVHLKLDATRLAAAILVILAAGAFLAPPWHGTAPLSLLMKMPVGAAVAIAVGWLIAPDWCLKGIGYLRRAAFR